MIRAYGETLIATMIWGFGFTSSIWALEGVGPIWQTAIRFGIAVLMLGGFTRGYRLSEFLKLFPVGLCLFGMIGFQTWGLKYTSATKSGFITVLYILFVPLFEWMLFRARIRRLLAIWIAIALMGTALICGVVTRVGVSQELLGALNLGDLLTLACAAFGALHIITVSKTVAGVSSPVRYHFYQCVWVFILASLVGTGVEGFSWISVEWSPRVWRALLQLGVFSTGVAFLIQVRVQRQIPPATLGLLLLMESPWAMFFSVTLVGEVLTELQIVGAGMLLLAAAGESWSVSIQVEQGGDEPSL